MSAGIQLYRKASLLQNVRSFWCARVCGNKSPLPEDVKCHEDAHVGCLAARGTSRDLFVHETTPAHQLACCRSLKIFVDCRTAQAKPVSRPRRTVT